MAVTKAKGLFKKEEKDPTQSCLRLLGTLPRLAVSRGRGCAAVISSVLWMERIGGLTLPYLHGRNTAVSNLWRFVCTDTSNEREDSRACVCVRWLTFLGTQLPSSSRPLQSSVLGGYPWEIWRGS